MSYTETEILDELDLAFEDKPSKYFTDDMSGVHKFNFFLDLEHGYCETAGSRIHLYADSTRWAIVLEKSGYFNRGMRAAIELNYVGNCVNYPVEHYAEVKSISNSSSVMLIDQVEFERIENKKGEGMETFELIAHNIKEIKVRDELVPFDNNYANYEKLGIQIRDYGNPNKLIGFRDLIRYFHETNPMLISANESEICEHIPRDIPKIMTINEFNHVSVYGDVHSDATPPSQQETYQLIAKVLVTKDVSNWAPTKEVNNSWKNWESGCL